jgi:HD-like signal output (HDOD) protein
MTSKALINARCIEAAIKGLPSLPPIVMRILEETDKDDVSISDVEQLLCTDQALVAKVLRIVNSSYYGLSGQVRSVSQAIVILGMRQVRNLVLGVSAMSVIQPKTQKNPNRINVLWSESYGTAIGSRIISKEKGLGEVQAELVFVGGLLRRIGKLFLYAYFEPKLEECQVLMSRWKLSETEAEEQILGLSQKAVGGKLAEHWRLPENLRELISFTDIPVDCPDENSYRIIRAASVACALDQEGGFIPLDTELPDIQWVKFNQSQWDWFFREVEQRVQSMSEYAGLPNAA